MIFRILTLMSLIGMVSSGTSVGGASENEPEEEDVRMGGEGFGNIVNLVALIGAAILVIVIVIAILSLSGQFVNDRIDPPV